MDKEVCLPGKTPIPRGLRAELERNGKARQYWLSLRPEEQEAVSRSAERLGEDERAIRSYVDGLVGWQEGHGPMQL